MAQIFTKKYRGLALSESKGFTLIELLVVIAVIGILTSIVLVALGGARGRARDARRMSDIRQISMAMEMFHSDTAAYPNYGAAGVVDAPTAIGDFLNPVPKDPGATPAACVNPENDYRAFGNAANPQQFCIWACLENGRFFAASQRGTRELTAAPGSLTCWTP